MTNPNFTDIVLLLDASGSMLALRPITLQSLKKFMDDQAFAIRDHSELEAHLHLYEFSETEKFEGGVGIGSQPDVLRHLDSANLRTGLIFNLDGYQPDGWTPLLDAMGELITHTGGRYAQTPEQKRPGQVLFVVITDGMENASKKYKWEDVKRMVEEQTRDYKWSFIFLGANMDAFAVGGKLGILRGNTMSWSANPAGTAAMYASLSRSTTKVVTGTADSDNLMETK